MRQLHTAPVFSMKGAAFVYKAYITIPKGIVYDTFVTEQALCLWKSFCTVEENPFPRQLRGEEICTFAKDADIIISGWNTIPYTEDITAQLPNLKIMVYTGGSAADVTPDGSLFRHGVKLLSGNEYFAMSVAEACLCYTICALRKVGLYYTEMKQSGWHISPWENRGLYHKKVGIIGYGAISRYFCELLKPFTSDILVCSDHLSAEKAAELGLKKAEKEEIFSTCDVVSVHSALKPETVGSIDRRLMRMMKQDAVLVNTARGAVVDEKAMIELLREEKIYAALDVYSVEAPISGPLEELKRLDRAFIMPHMGGPTIDMRGILTGELAKEVKAHLEAGKPMMSEVKPFQIKNMSRDSF